MMLLMLNKQNNHCIQNCVLMCFFIHFGLFWLQTVYLAMKFNEIHFLTLGTVLRPLLHFILLSHNPPSL